VPRTCWVSRSSSRNGSVRMSMIGASFAGAGCQVTLRHLYSMAGFYLTRLD
jgi:hypothetical protein